MKLLLTCLLLMLAVVTLVTADEAEETKGMSIFHEISISKVTLSYHNRNIIINNGYYAV